MSVRLGLITLAAALGSISAAPAAAPQQHLYPAYTVQVWAWIDGHSRLELMGDTATWEHFTGAGPGRFWCVDEGGGFSEPTWIDSLQWYPVWPFPFGTPCDLFDCGRGPMPCRSLTHTGLTQPLPLEPYWVSLEMLTGRQRVRVTEQPSLANGYRLSIEFEDFLYWADDLYGVELKVFLPSPAPYCTSSANSTGRAGRIFVAGSRSVSANATRLLADRCPPGHPAIFLCGSTPAWIPFGSGTLCISPFAPGLTRVHSPVLVDPAGDVEQPLDFSALTPPGMIVAGSTWCFQLWFRDNPPGGTGSNLTDAIQVEFHE